MDRPTVDVYDARGAQWASRRQPVRREDARGFAFRVAPGGLRIDLGCGAGRYVGDLGAPVVGLDASATMLQLCRATAPGTALVRGDLEALPFGRASLRGAWANMSYLHLPSVQLPAALADLHRALAVGAPLDIQVLAGTYEGHDLPEDDLGGRFFASWTPARLRDVLEGAGFTVEALDVERDAARARAQRARTLADTVAAGMRILVVGLNPSCYASDAGVAYARPGNRFWPAALAAGLVSRDRDAGHALQVHGVGMTDVVKRATPGASALSQREYSEGFARLERLVDWLRPAAVCFVGLAGWRAAIDRHAAPGPQDRAVGGRPAYLMPSTSGANAGSTLTTLTSHLVEAARFADAARRRDET